jgi:hypothetical protein
MERPPMAMVAGGMIAIKRALIREETEGESGGRCDFGAPLRIETGIREGKREGAW